MNQMKRILLPLMILTGGVILTIAILSSSDEHQEKIGQVQTRPLVAIEIAEAITHQVVLNAWGELKPREITKLSLQVSGRVNHLHPNFVEGGIIKKGEVIFAIENDDYLTQIIESEANLASAQSKLAQEIAEANVAKTQWRNIKEQATLLSLREPQLLYARATVKSAQANLSQSKRNLERTQFKSPYDALIIKRDVGLGELASQGAILGEVYNIERADIVLPIPQFDFDFLPKQVKGLIAKVEFDNGQRNAYISRELGIVSDKTRMNHIVTTIEDPYAIHNDADSLKFGQYVKVKVSAKTLNNVILINQDHVDNNTVWLLDENEKLQQQSIIVERTEGKSLYVSGLQNGDQLVVKLPSYPQIGMKVRRNDLTLANELTLLKEAE
jgi:RND family efflux transporter MFP subunit